MKPLLPLLVWVVFITLNAFYHAYIIEKEKRWPDHIAWTGIRFVVLVLLVAFNPYRYQQILIGGAMLFPLFFNSILNLARHKKLIYLSDHGVDGFLMKLIESEFAWFFWELLAGIFGVYLMINGDPLW